MVRQNNPDSENENPVFSLIYKILGKGRTWKGKEDYLGYLSLREREIGQWRENDSHMYIYNAIGKSISVYN